MTELRGQSTACVVCGYDFGDLRHRWFCINSPLGGTDGQH